MAKFLDWDNERMIKLIHEIKKEPNENVSLWSLQSLRNFSFADGFVAGRKYMGKEIIKKIELDIKEEKENEYGSGKQEDDIDRSVFDIRSDQEGS